MKVDEWRSRWVQIGGLITLHRVRRIANRRAWKDLPSGPGETVCGKKGNVNMPGFLSRMSAKRCPRCCELVGIPKGIGAPYNDPTLFPPEGRALDSTSARRDEP